MTAPNTPTEETAVSKGPALTDSIVASLSSLRDFNNNKDEHASGMAKAAKDLNKLNFSDIENSSKEQTMTLLCHHAKKNPNGHANFEDVPANVIVDNVFPFLITREDWVSLAIVNKDINTTIKSSSTKILPPWPNDCEFSYPYNLRDPVWSADGTLLASKAGMGNRIAIFCQQNGFVKEWEAQHRWSVSSLAFAPNGKFLLSSGYDRRVKMWDCENSYKCIHDWGHLIGGTKEDPNNTDLVVFPDSKSFVLLQEGSICLVDADNGSVVQSVLLTSDCIDCKKIFFAPDSHAVIFGVTEFDDTEGELPVCRGKIKVWNLDSEGFHESIDCYDITGERGVTDLAISSDGVYVASGIDFMVQLWNFTEGRLEPEKKFECNKDLFFRAVAFTPCGKYLAAVGGYDHDNFDEGYLVFWDLVSGETERHLYFDASVNSIRYSSEGICLLQIGEDIMINALLSYPEKIYSDDKDIGEVIYSSFDHKNEGRIILH